MYDLNTVCEHVYQFQSHRRDTFGNYTVKMSGRLARMIRPVKYEWTRDKNDKRIILRISTFDIDRPTTHLR